MRSVVDPDTPPLTLGQVVLLALGATFLALYLAQFPFALALLQTPFQFNVLENFFLGTAPSTYDLNPGTAGGA